MKIEYKCHDSDKEFLTNLKNSDNIFENKCYDIQKIWLRIHACLCGTCPYFVYDKELSELIDKKYLDNKKKNKKIHLIRWLRQKCNECKRDKEDNCITPDGIIESCSNCRYFDRNVAMMK